jgi:Bacterial Ig domain
MEVSKKVLWLRRASIPIALIALLVFAGPTLAKRPPQGGGGGGGKGNAKADTVPPTIAISAPTAQATVSSTVDVDGSASDNVGVTSVSLAVDNGSFNPANGTSSWSDVLNTLYLSDGDHTLTARAVDQAGNVGTAQITISVQNAPTPTPTPAPDTTPPHITFNAPADGAQVAGKITVSGNASDNAALASVQIRVDSGAWGGVTGMASWSTSLDTTTLTDGTHEIDGRATDSAGNVTTASISVQVQNATQTSTFSHLVTPEGVTIDVNSAGGWTASQIYDLLKPSALDLPRIGPSLVIKVQDTVGSQTVTSAVGTPGSYTAFQATMYLKGVSSTFASQPDAQIAHEYGHVWSLFHLYIDHGGDWSSYLAARWSTADGSVTLATDPRLGSSYTWDTREIIADDYRLLFGSAKAVSERPTHMNTSIPEPWNVDGLKASLANW